MKPWTYVAIAVVATALIAFVLSNNGDEETAAPPQADGTSQEVASGAIDTTLYVLSPESSIALLLEQPTLPEEAVPGLEQAQQLYAEALTKPAEEAVPLMQQCEEILRQTSEQISDTAMDTSNQVAEDNLKRLAGAISVIADRVQADRESLEGTGTPEAVAANGRMAS